MKANALPANVEAERFLLGAILLDDSVFPEGVTVDFFSGERHRRLWRRICDVKARGEAIDRLTLYNELQRRGETEPDTMSFLADLDTGVPQLPKLDSYVRILQEHAQRRRIIFAAKNLADRAGLGSENLADIIATGQEFFSTPVVAAEGYRSIEDIPTLAECGSVEVEFIRQPDLPRATLGSLTGPPGDGKSSLAFAWLRDAWRHKGIPGLVLDRENPSSVMADRLRRLGMEDGPHLPIWGGWLPSEPPQPDHPMVRAWVKQHRGIVVVESLSAYLEGGDENDASVVRPFMQRCRCLADLGGTVIVTHNDGKSETARDYRGSSDFKAAIDWGFHVTNLGATGRLDKLVLRCFKSRLGFAGELVYHYADGQFLRATPGEATQTITEQLTVILRLNPGISGKRFEELARQRNISREQAREFLFAGCTAGSVQRETGANNAKRYFLAGIKGQSEL